MIIHLHQTTMEQKTSLLTTIHEFIKDTSMPRYILCISLRLFYKNPLKGVFPKNIIGFTDYFTY